MDDYSLDGKFHEATEAFCRLSAGGRDVRGLVSHVMSWTHFLSFHRKRTLSTACYELYQQYFMA